MLTDPAYAGRVDRAAFRAEVLALHRRLTGPRDSRGRWQPPWPRWLGTPPWAVARELGGRHVSWVRTDPTGGFDRTLAAVRSGQVVPIYVGSRWLPRHVVLAIGESTTGGIRCYEPSRGRVVDVLRKDVGPPRRLRLAGWSYVWCVVVELS